MRNPSGPFSIYNAESERLSERTNQHQNIQIAGTGMNPPRNSGSKSDNPSKWIKSR